MVRGEVERRAEALDLQRPRQLPADAVRDAVRRDDEEREEGEHDDAGADGQADRAPRAGRGAARRTERDGHEHGRIELHRDRRAEQAEAEPVAPVHERGERGGHERGREEVEARQHDRAEQERERRDERQRADGPLACRAEPAQRHRGEQHRRNAASAISSSKTSRKPASSSLSERRHDEREQRSGRVLRPDVAVRHGAVLDRVAVARVDRDVDDLAVVVPGRVQRRPGEQEERRGGDRRELSEPARRGHVGRAGRRRRRGRTRGCRDRTSASARARSRSGSRR